MDESGLVDLRGPSRKEKKVMGNEPGTPLTRKRMALAFCVAAAADAASIVAELFPWVLVAIDGATAIVLLLILGFRWQFVPAIAAEAVPVLAIFPSWMAAVLAIVASAPRDERRTR
ncbi:MAG TPA: hypothetical protein VM509_03280 [Planctomycetota bacterium]|nr:hypothetical protein [Planctomycetota bacterium]